MASCGELAVTPHVAQNDACPGGSAIDGRTTSHPGYAVSMRKRKMMETTFGWVEQYGGLRRVMFSGIERVDAAVIFAVSVFNLLRIRNIAAKNGINGQGLLEKRELLKQIEKNRRSLIIFLQVSFGKGRIRISV